jgi:hypothetical protein
LLQEADQVIAEANDLVDCLSLLKREEEQWTREQENESDRLQDGIRSFGKKVGNGQEDSPAANVRAEAFGSDCENLLKWGRVAQPLRGEEADLIQRIRSFRKKHWQ